MPPSKMPRSDPAPSNQTRDRMNAMRANRFVSGCVEASFGSGAASSSSGDTSFSSGAASSSPGASSLRSGEGSGVATAAGLTAARPLDEVPATLSVTESLGGDLINSGVVWIWTVMSRALSVSSAFGVNSGQSELCKQLGRGDGQPAVRLPNADSSSCLRRAASCGTSRCRFSSSPWALKHSASLPRKP